MSGEKFAFMEGGRGVVRLERITGERGELPVVLAVALRVHEVRALSAVMRVVGKIGGQNCRAENQGGLLQGEWDSLSHLKRVRKRHDCSAEVMLGRQGGEMEDWAILGAGERLEETRLAISNLFLEHGIDPLKLSATKSTMKDAIAESLFLVRVPAGPCCSRAEWEEARLLWPLPYHEPPPPPPPPPLEEVEKGLAAAASNGKFGAAIVHGNGQVLARAGADASHPLGHAVMRVVEAMAARDRSLWPEKGNGALGDEDCTTYRKRPKIEVEKSYLCTGMTAYCMYEPCLMCAMALLHSRVRAVIYSERDPINGALGGKLCLHRVRATNHHYEVYRAVQ